MKFTRIAMVVISFIQIINYAFLNIFIKALLDGKVSAGLFGGVEAVIGVTIFVNMVIVYDYARWNRRNGGNWALGAFLFHFFIPILLAVLPVPKDEKASSGYASSGEPEMPKTLLNTLLDSQPVATQKQVGQAMASVPCNFEFFVAVNIPEMQTHMDNASDKGFVVWCNEDGKLAVMYGAGKIRPETFADCMKWINDIRVVAQPAMTHFMTNDGEKIIEIK